MISMKDIAERCGVSVATVSKALNGQPDIGEETRTRVRKMADELGYFTNSAARALKTRRTYNIGILFVDERSSGLAHEYFSSMLDSLKVEAEAHGYDVTFINRNIGRKSTTYLQHCLYRSVDGVVIACVDFEDPQVEELVASPLPVVTIDHVFNHRIAVMSDNVTGMEELTRHVLEKGYQNPAFIHGERTAVTENRIIGFYRACEQAGIDVPDAHVMESAYHDPESCAVAVKALLDSGDRPDCIFFPDDFSAIGGMNAIREAGLKMPEDIGVAGYDGIGLTKLMNPPLTTYKQDTVRIGRTAAARLVELIENPRTALLDRVRIEGCLVEGAST